LADLLRAILALGILSGLNGCAHPSIQKVQASDPIGGLHATERAVDPSREALARELAALAPSVRAEEARELANCACDYPQQLARMYGVVRPALLHNFLVNVGVKKRGLCYQWAEDLLAQLQTLHLVTLQLRWGMARVGTYREHNCIVVTAHGQPFAQGIVLDAWRHSGRLTWTRVFADTYPWQEGELYLTPKQPQTSAAGHNPPH
jgi:hypothetical protein